VDEEEFPGYLNTIGGRENAMDLATMEEKIESGRYKTMDQFEVSLFTAVRCFSRLISGNDCRRMLRK
jgi:hypothetical protein